MPETINFIFQISEICWNSNTSSYLNRRQFYSALKLVAAYQAGLAISGSLLTADMELPLPRFTWIKHEDRRSPPDAVVGNLIELSDSVADCNDYRYGNYEFINRIFCR